MTLREENFVLFNGVIDEVFSTKNNLKDLEELNWIATGGLVIDTKRERVPF